MYTLEWNGPHKTVVQQIAAKSELAAACDFGDKSDEMLDDKFESPVLEPERGYALS